MRRVPLSMYRETDSEVGGKNTTENPIRITADWSGVVQNCYSGGATRGCATTQNAAAPQSPGAPPFCWVLPRYPYYSDRATLDDCPCSPTSYTDTAFAAPSNAIRTYRPETVSKSQISVLVPRP